MKKIIKFTAVPVVIIALIIFITASTAKAFTKSDSDENIFVAENQLVPYNFVAAGRVIDFQGEAQKDIMVIGETVNINGPVHGDVIVAGVNVKINSNIDGNLRVLGGKVEINGHVKKNVTVAGGDVVFGDNSKVDWDVMLGAGTAVLRGTIDGNIHVASGALDVGGFVGGDVVAYVGDDGRLSVLSGANIDGDLKYWSATTVIIPDNAKVLGAVEYTSTLNLVEKNSRTNILNYLYAFSFSILSSLIIGLIILYIFNKPASKVILLMNKLPASSIGWGFAFLFLTPIISIILLFFIVTIPLAVIMMMFWLLAIYLSKIFVAILLGNRIMLWLEKDFKLNTKKMTATTALTVGMIVGLILYFALASLPYVGLLFSFISTIWALGAIFRVASFWMSPGKVAIRNSPVGGQGGVNKGEKEIKK